MEIIKDLTLLTERADEINIDDKKLLKKIINDLKETLLENKNIAGLSAPQIGYQKRIFCINFNGDIRTFINPIIAKTEGLHLSREACASIPDMEYIVPRFTLVVGIYQDPQGNPQSNKFDGKAAELFQSLINCLDGVYVSDFGLPILPGFDEASEAERQEVIDKYLQGLGSSNSQLMDEIEHTPELKQQLDAVRFMAKVQAGEIKLEPIQPKSTAISDAIINKIGMRNFISTKLGRKHK